MNPAVEKAIAPAVNGFHSIAIAVVVIAILAAVVANTVGGKTRQQRKATFGLVTAIGFILFAIFVLPKVLGTHG